MGIWDAYADRVAIVGEMRPMWIDHTKSSIARRMRNSPSCHLVPINGVEQYVTITHRTQLNEKIICAMPGESLKHGGIVEWAGHHWMITQADANDTIYDKGIMIQCNHLLRWIGNDGNLKEKWCFVEDGTKYLIGEFAERIMSIGDARIALTIPKDEDTAELERGRRFLIDDVDSSEILAYQITKPNRLFNIFNDEGVYKFILNEVTFTDNDNLSKRIADYYNWMPPIKRDGDHRDSDITVPQIVAMAEEDLGSAPDDEKEEWL